MRYLLPAILCFTLFIGSCKKKEDSAPVCNVTTIMFPGIDTLVLTYDEQNRITEYNYHRSVDVQINYSGITATSTATNYMDTTRPFLKLYLNTAGNLESMTQGTLYGATGYYSVYNFTYDSEGHIVRSESAVTNNAAHTTDYYADSIIYENGNLVRKYSLRKVYPATDFTLSESTVITYTSDLNKAGYFPVRFENVPMGIGNGAYLFPLIGTASKNLPALTSVYTAAGTLQYEVAYTIALNADGYPAEENADVRVTPPYIQHRTFEYTCR